MWARKKLYLKARIGFKNSQFLKVKCHIGESEKCKKLAYIIWMTKNENEKRGRHVMKQYNRMKLCRSQLFTDCSTRSIRLSIVFSQPFFWFGLRHSTLAMMIFSRTPSWFNTVKLGYNDHGYNEITAITNKNYRHFLVLSGFFTTYIFTVITISRL